MMDEFVVAADPDTRSAFRLAAQTGGDEALVVARHGTVRAALRHHGAPQEERAAVFGKLRLREHGAAAIFIEMHRPKGQCGAVRYRAEGPPVSTSLCHCFSCRRATGGPSLAWAIFDEDKVAITRGALAVYALFSFRTTKAQFIDLVAGEADRSSGLILRATHDGMRLNRLDEVQAMIERLAQGTDVAAIRVFDKDGAVVMSSDRGELGRRAGLEDPPCVGCHGTEAPAASRATARIVC